MNATDPAKLIMERMLRLLRWRVWIAEKLHPTEWQITLLWAALAGFLGALASLLFLVAVRGRARLVTRSGPVSSGRCGNWPWWACTRHAGRGGALAVLVLLFGKKLTRNQSSTDYMEAIAIGNGRSRSVLSLVKTGAALFSIGPVDRSGGRPMVQLAAVVSSRIARWRKIYPAQHRLLVACGAAAGIASAYNAPIAGSFFVAEIILGTIAMESLGACSPVSPSPRP